jgi:hypothetical protein
VLKKSKPLTTNYCCTFSGLKPSFSIIKTKPLHFGSWLCSHLQVKLPVLLGPIEGANPTRDLISPEDGSRASLRNVVASFLQYWTMDQVHRNSNIEWNAPSLEPYRAVLLLYCYACMYRVIEKSRNPFLTRVCQKNKVHWNQKTKKNVVLSAGNVHRVHRCMYSLFSWCLLQPGEVFLCHGNGSPDKILSICLAQENREMYL